MSNLSQLCYLLFLFLKQFYILPSGSFQLGDAFFILSFLFFAIKSRKNKEWGQIVLVDKWYLLFTIAAFISNHICYFLYEDMFSLFSGFYLIYNYIVIVVFRAMARNYGFLDKAKWVCRLNLWVQGFLLVSGLGKYRFEHRYIGSFHDPNQMAFFVFSMILIIYLIQRKRKQEKWIYLDILLGALLIFYSKSVGIALGLIIFVGTLLIQKGKRIFLVMAAGLCLGLLLPDKDSYSLFVRMYEKFQVLCSANGVKEILAMRGIDRVWLYPEYLLWGAGDGAYTRFAESRLPFQEIHSTLLQLWFCYGSVPFLFLLKWLYQNLKKVPKMFFGIYAALFVESFFLVNARQPFFWIIILLGKTYIEESRSEQNETKKNMEPNLFSSGYPSRL